jgi:hypothetical protein
MTASERFFQWVRESSEAQWSAMDAKSDDALASGPARGTLWCAHTRWSPGLSEEEIASCEARYGVRFPEAYRAMLRVMGGAGPTQRVGYFDDSAVPLVKRSPGVLDPRADEAEILARIDGLAERLWPDVADASGSGYTWPETFGADPGERASRLAAIRRWLDEAPRVWPLFLHRYLVLDARSESPPVLSIWHCNDTIVYGETLEDYLVHELSLDARLAPPRAPRETVDPTSISHWGALLE